MSNVLSSLPGIVLSAGSILGVIAIGILFVAGVWKKGKDGEDDRLINILKSTVDTLEKKVDDQKKNHDEILSNLTKNIHDLTVKVDNLERENETLTKVLQGRDEQTQNFYKKAFDAMEVANKTLILVETMNKNHTELMKMLVDHLKPGVTINNQPSQSNPPDHIVL